MKCTIYKEGGKTRSIISGNINGDRANKKLIVPKSHNGRI
jgi:hypothetical protein